MTSPGGRSSKTFFGKRLLTALLFLHQPACDKPPPEPTGDDEPSPNASILPSPLASTPPLPLTDAGREPRADADAASSPDSSAERAAPLAYPTTEPLPTEIVSPLDSTGMLVDADLVWYPWVDAEAPGPEPQAKHPVQIQLLSQGRLRFVIKSDTLHVQPETELRTQVDRLGHVLVWADQSAYRVLTQGSLRAFFQEYRGDVAPLLKARVHVLDSSASPAPTEISTIETKMGKLTLEQRLTPALGGSAQLLCRLLVELVLAQLDDTVCRRDWLPVRADYRWRGGGRFGFLTRSTNRVMDLHVADFTIPPDSAGLRAHDVPPVHRAVRPNQETLKRLAPTAKPPLTEQQADLPERGLMLANRYGTPRYVSIGSAQVGWIPPQKSLHLTALNPGGYEVLARDFLGIERPFRQVVAAPGRTVLGEPEQQPATPR